MIIIGIVLAFIGLAYLCWLLFALAIYALPFFAGVTAGLATYHSGSGPIAAIIVGAIASSIRHICRRLARDRGSGGGGHRWGPGLWGGGGSLRRARPRPGLAAAP